MDQKGRQAALDYHAFPKPGKLSVSLSKPTQTPEDLSLAYTPGVAEPVRAIAADPNEAYRYTIKGNLVAVISDGTAILGLGNLGPLASKPVMEGKAVLFKRFANIDVFDIEVASPSPESFIETVVNISPTFGAINLEDIKAPQCFEIEQALIERLNIPVFHDDQHGTAVVVSAALLNALSIQGKTLATAKIVCLGAGAAGIATMRLLMSLGAHRDAITMVDSQGIVHVGRQDLNPYKFAFAQETDKRSLADALCDADVVIGVSGPNLLSADMLKSMAPKPIVFALSNPDPEIHPDLARATRSDLIMATGRSDYPNQVNNVLCFPFIFRGALDVRARCINQSMLMAAVQAIRLLAQEPVPASMSKAYAGISLTFGPEYILPKPFDPRLLSAVSVAVAQAAIESGVAQTHYVEYPCEVS
jgi:malate dehydrogenase (oxaloacetate-decarboxylating)(NADP+)